MLLNLFLQQKIMNNHENLQNMPNILIFSNRIAAKIIKHYEKSQNMTKQLKFLNSIAATNHHPPFSFWLGGWVLCASSSARGKTVLYLHFIRRFMVNVDYFSNANASANANANAKVLLNLFLQKYHPCTHAPMHTSFFPFS